MDPRPFGEHLLQALAVRRHHVRRDSHGREDLSRLLDHGLRPGVRHRFLPWRTVRHFLQVLFCPVSDLHRLLTSACREPHRRDQFLLVHGRLWSLVWVVGRPCFFHKNRRLSISVHGLQCPHYGQPA